MKFDVIETVVTPSKDILVGLPPRCSHVETHVVRRHMSRERALQLRDQMNDKVAKTVFDPNRLVSYRVDSVS